MPEPVLIGIDAITYGVEDLARSRKFFTEWGLKEVSATADAVSFETLDGGQVALRPATAPALPPAFEPGSTMREVIWGVETQRELDELVGRIANSASVARGDDGVARCTDPNGMCVGFRVSRRRKVEAKAATPVNAPGAPARVDQASPIYERATPIGIGHVVFFVDDLAATERFYREGLGFQLSDRYPGDAVFLRCRPTGGHHNLFLLRRPGKPGLNHVAFTVCDIHEVFGGGLDMSRKGWETDIGPGRHPISSAYFWYFRNPAGGSAEYFADEDYLTERWQPRDFERNLANFTEWAVKGGIDGTTRRQKA